MGADPRIQRLLETNPLREPVLRSVIRALQLPTGSHGLDAGCGIGLQALLLAEAVGCDGHITGLDIAPDFLAYAASLTQGAGLSERITLREGDVQRLPFAADSFDWMWSADCIGYPLAELLPLLQELVRVVRPGGSVNLVAWSSQRVLPGYPLLESRLNSTCSSYRPYLQGKCPDLHFLRALPWLRMAGLEEVKGQTFVGDVQAPLSSAERAALVALFEMLWTSPEPAAAEWSEYQRLCTPASPDFIVDQPGYYAFFTYTVFRGMVPARGASGSCS